MEVDKAVKGRRSIRKYTKRRVDDSVIEEILDLARYAPSSMNGQPWTFVVVRDDERKRKLVEIKNEYCPIEKREYAADFLLAASVIVVICVDKGKSFDRGVENGVFAAANLLLAAHARGLGSVYMSAYKRDEPTVSEAIREVLGIPSHIDPVSILPLGYPDETPEPKNMEPIHGLVSYESYGQR